MAYNYQYEGIDHTILINEANALKIRPHVHAYESYKSSLSSQLVWLNPSYDTDALDDTYADLDFCSKEFPQNIAEKLSLEISEKIQFPRNSIYLMALGALSSAMNIRFYVQTPFGAKEPTNLYVIASQPPSTGKSGVMKPITQPIEIEYNRLAEQNRAARAGIKYELDKLAADKPSNSTAAQAIEERRIKLEKQLEEVPLWKYSLDDATPEAIVDEAMKQQGVFSVVADEAEAINNMLGSIYTNGSGAKNFGIFLKGWDNGKISFSRITRGSGQFNARGVVAVMAQDEVIRAILTAGGSGRGIPERIMMIREKPMLGSREYNDENYGQATTLKNMAGYIDLIKNIMDEAEDVVLTLSEDAISRLRAEKNFIEPHLADGEKYSQSVMRGIMGKMDKQATRLAAVLHVAENWARGGLRSTEIGFETMHNAIAIFMQLSDAYQAAADSQGFTGDKTCLNEIYESLQFYASKKEFKIPHRKLQEKLRKRDKAFSGFTGLAKQLKEKYLPMMDEANVCLFDDKYIYINPKLKQ